MSQYDGSTLYEVLVGYDNVIYDKYGIGGLKLYFFFFNDTATTEIYTE